MPNELLVTVLTPQVRAYPGRAGNLAGVISRLKTYSGVDPGYQIKSPEEAKATCNTLSRDQKNSV